MRFCVFVLLEASAKLRKVTISYFISIPLSLSLSVLLSVRLSDRPHEVTWLPRNYIFEFFFFENLSIKFKFYKNLTRITCTSHEDQQ